MNGRILLSFALFGAGSAAAAEEPPRSEPLAIRRATGAIAFDGQLDDPGWPGAAIIDRFYETEPGDDTEPKVKTVAWVTYDERFFYIAVKCFDPEPGRVRAPYGERDNVLGTDDNVALRPSNVRRSRLPLPERGASR